MIQLLLARGLFLKVFFSGLESEKVDKLISMNRNRVYIILHLFIVLGVIASFRLIDEKRWASVLATSLFLLGAMVVLVWEFRKRTWRKSFSFYAALAFLALFVLPIIFLRVASWNGIFELETILGVSGAQLHLASNKAFMAMIGAFFVQAILEKQKPS